MSLPRFLYYLLKSDGRSGTVINKVVSFTGTPTPIRTPDGWQDLLIQIERKIDEHGISGSVTLPLGLVAEGAQIARDGIYKNTVEDDLFILIQRLFLELTDTKFKWIYKYFYKAQLKLPNAEDSLDKFKVPVSETSLMSLIRSNIKTVYKFPMNDPRCVNVMMDGINKQYTKKYSIQKEQELFGDDNYWLGMFGIGNDGSSTNLAFFDVDFQSSVVYPNAFQFIENVLTQDIRIKGNINVYFDQNVGFELRVETNTVGASPQYSLVNILGDPRPAGTVENFTFDTTITMPAGTKLNMKIFNNSGLHSKVLTVVDGEIEIEYKFRNPTTYVKGWPRFSLYQEIIKRITGDENYASSQLCLDFNSDIITCGNALRGFDPNTTALETSLEDFIRDCDATYMTGWDILPDKVEIEDRLKYYTEDDIVDLGPVKEFVKKPANDLMCNTFKFGHKQQDIEDVNGKYDPNGNNAFVGPLTRTDPKEYNMVSPYKAGPQEIENIRINLENKKSTDDNSDKEIFVLACKKSEPLSISVEFSSLLGGILVSNFERFRPGQQIRITGSSLNDGVYDVDALNSIIVAKIVSFSQPVVDEGPVVVNIEFLIGEIYILDRPNWDTLEGVPDDTTFNLVRLTPKSMFNRHKRWIGSMNAGLENKKIVFSSGKENKNTELKTELNGVVVDEDADENISDFGPNIFKPWYFIFKAETFTMLTEKLEENRNRAYKFTDEFGEEWIGILMIAGLAPNDYTPQEYRLLAAPSNDIKKLIHA